MRLNKALLKNIYDLYIEDAKIKEPTIMRKFKINFEQAKEYLLECMRKNHIESSRKRWKIYDKV